MRFFTKQYGAWHTGHYIVANVTALQWTIKTTFYFHANSSYPEHVWIDSHFDGVKLVDHVDIHEI